MNKLRKLGVELTRNELKSIKGSLKFAVEGKCVTSGCRSTSDCGDADGCGCYFNSPTDYWGYCQIR